MSWMQFVSLVFLFLAHPIIEYDVYVEYSMVPCGRLKHTCGLGPLPSVMES